MLLDTRKREDGPRAAERPRKAGQDDGGEQRRPREIGGPEGPEPTRYGDWERNGRCHDF